MLRCFHQNIHTIQYNTIQYNTNKPSEYPRASPHSGLPSSALSIKTSILFLYYISLAQEDEAELAAIRGIPVCVAKGPLDLFPHLLKFCAVRRTGHFEDVILRQDGILHRCKLGYQTFVNELAELMPENGSANCSSGESAQLLGRSTLWHSNRDL